MIVIAIIVTLNMITGVNFLGYASTPRITVALSCDHGLEQGDDLM